MQPFSIKESFKRGWELTKAHIGLILGAEVIYYIIGLVGNMFRDPNGHAPLWAIPIIFISAVFSMIVGIGFLKMFLFLDKSEKFSISDLFKHYRLFWKYLGGTLLSGLIIAVGFIVFVIPGFYFTVKYFFTTYLIIDQGLGPIEALKKSALLTEGVKWKLISFLLVSILVNIAGAIVFFVGLLVTIPITLFATVYIYRQLLAARTETKPIDDGALVNTPESALNAAV